MYGEDLPGAVNYSSILLTALMKRDRDRGLGASVFRSGLFLLSFHVLPFQQSSQQPFDTSHTFSTEPAAPLLPHTL